MDSILPGGHARTGGPANVRLSEVFGGLSYALDLTEGQRPGHSVRATLIGMRIGRAIGLPPADQASLFHALLLKDLGCSSNAARFAAIFGHHDHELKATIAKIDWPNALESFRFVARSVSPGHFWLKRVWKFLSVMARGPEGAREVVRTRCERSAEIAELLGMSPATVSAVRTIDEHWDGKGQPYSLAGHAIPQLGRIVGLAQTMEVFNSTYGRNAAYDMAIARRGRWFEPSLVDALKHFRRDDDFWQALADGRELSALHSIEPPELVAVADPETLDRVAEAFARVIDAKSPWTYQHSNGVAELAVGIAHRMGFSDAALRELRLAALLHDLGKLGVSNLILDKPGKLTDDEMTVMRQHPAHTAGILGRVSCFGRMVEDAASHHEKLDGSGYHRRLGGEALSTTSRILCVADICDALRASRPYRAGLAVERILAIMNREAGTALDADCVAALTDVLYDSRTTEPAAVPAARIVTALAEDYHQAA